MMRLSNKITHLKMSLGHFVRMTVNTTPVDKNQSNGSHHHKVGVQLKCVILSAVLHSEHWYLFIT
jgi:hypothetical protein